MADKSKKRRPRKGKVKTPTTPKKPKKREIGSGAEARVYQISPRRVERVMYVREGWKEKNETTLKILREMAKSKKKTKYLCPIYGVSVRKAEKGAWLPYKVIIKMAKARHTAASSNASQSIPFRMSVKKECEKWGLRPPSDWHGYNVMELGGRAVRVDYFPWYQNSQPGWMEDNFMNNYDYPAVGQ